jgi:hypothetical protein
MKYPLQTLIAVATLSLGVMQTASAAKPGVIEEAELENSTFKKDWDYEFEINDADGNVSSVCSSQPGASSSMLKSMVSVFSMVSKTLFSHHLQALSSKFFNISNQSSRSP